MTDFMVRMFTDYAWFAWLVLVLAGAGCAYVAVWVAGLSAFASDWVAYRRAVLGYKAAVRRRLEAAPCAVCELADEGTDPPEYQHPDGPDDPGWDEPGDDWSPRLAWGPGLAVPKTPMAGLAEVLKKAHDLGLLDDDQLPDGPPAEAPEGRCTNRDCDLFGFIHRPPCRLSPTMPAACYPAMGLKDGPAMPPQPWSGLHASLEVLARGDDSPTLTGIVAAELGHDTTEAAVDSMFTRAQAREVEAMIADTVIPTGETGRSQA